MMADRAAAGAREDVLDRLRRARASTSPSTRGAVAAHFGTEHHEEVFTAERDARPPARRSSTGLDEPFADASILPTYLLSRFTREPVTVALGGDGSDELLAGYPTFPADRVARLLPGAAASCTSASSSRSSTGCPVSTDELQPRLQGQAVPSRRARAPPSLATRRGSARSRPTSRRRCSTRASARPARRAAARVRRRRRATRPARAAHLPLREDVPPGRHPREGRPREHGELARGAGAVPRRRRSSSSSDACRRDLKLRRLRHEAPAEARDGGPACRRASRERKKKGFGIPVARVAARPRCASRCRTSSRPTRLARQGLFEPHEVQRLIARAPRAAGATTASSSGRCSSSSSGIAAGSRSGSASRTTAAASGSGFASR